MIVSIDALFSLNSRIGSKIISTGTKHLSNNIKEVPSHTALLVNGRWVHESTMHSGVQVVSYDKWSKIHKEIDRIPLKSMEYQEVANIFRLIKNKKYDYMGILYFGLVIIPTFFGATLPKLNKWESKNKYFCCEVLGKLTGHYYGMSSPTQILEMLRDGRR